MTSYFCDRPHKLSWALVIIVINCFVDGWYLHIYSPDGSAAPARWLSYLWKQCTTISNFHVTLHFDLPARKLVVSYTRRIFAPNCKFLGPFLDWAGQNGHMDSTVAMCRSGVWQVLKICTCWHVEWSCLYDFKC